jgi:hypothetical protein
MKIKFYISRLLGDLQTLEPESLSNIVRYVRNHITFTTITLLTRNTKSAANYILDQCLDLFDEKDPVSDIQLAGLMVVVADVYGDKYSDLVSRTSSATGNYYWASAMATSLIINKEVLENEELRITA